MKKHLLFLCLLLLTINLSANSKLRSTINCSEFDEILIRDNQIKVAGKFVGKFEVKTKDLEVNSKEKIMIYEVSIFKKKWRNDC